MQSLLSAEKDEDPVRETAKRRQILDGAREVFVSRGFDVASMNDIVRASGVSKSTLYTYFRSKEELFEALISVERERYFSEISALLSEGGPPREVLQRYGERLASLMLSSDVLYATRTVIAVAHRMPRVGRSFYERGPVRGHGLLVAYLEGQVSSGAMRIDDLDLASWQFIELCLAGLFRRSLFEGCAGVGGLGLDLGRVVGGAVLVFWSAYGVEDGAGL